MTNTTQPMTFEDYFKQTFPYGVRSAHTKDVMKAIWNVCQAQQAQTIAELVEALEVAKEILDSEGVYTRNVAKIDALIAKVKGK